MTGSPISLGLGLKPEHFGQALDTVAPGLWFEVHAENYFVQGGARLRDLLAVRERHPVSLHGVGLSLAGDQPPCERHLARLRSLIGQVRPVLVSEHLAWSRWRGASLPDLLPFPRTRRALARVIENVERAQQALGVRLAIENPSHYLHLEGHEIGEIEFLDELSRRSGCGLLVDVNNVHVSAVNMGWRSTSLIDAFPADRIVEIHLAGHRPDPQLGAALLIDSHDAPVAEAVWSLYRRLIRRVGARPTLIERDAELPAFSELMAERERGLRECTVACPEVLDAA